MPPKSKSKAASMATPIVKTRSGRKVVVPERATFEVSTRTQGRIAHEDKKAKKAVATEIEAQPVEVDDPNFIHAMVGPSTDNMDAQDDDEDDEETEYNARMSWYVHTIKLRDGRDFTQAVRDKTINLEGLQKHWRQVAEADVAMDATLTKAQTKGKKKAANEPNPSKYLGITPGTVEHPMKNKNKTTTTVQATPVRPIQQIPPTPSLKRLADADELDLPATKTARTGAGATKLRRTDSTTISLGKLVQNPVCLDVPILARVPPNAAAPQPKPLATKAGTPKPIAAKPITSKPTTPYPPTPKPPALKPPALKPPASKTAIQKPSTAPPAPKPVALKPATPKPAMLSRVILKAQAGPFAPIAPKPTWLGMGPEAPAPIVAPVRDLRVQPASFIYRSPPQSHKNPAPVATQTTGASTSKSTPSNPGQTRSREASRVKRQQWLVDQASSSASNKATKAPVYGSPLRRELVLAHSPRARLLTPLSAPVVENEPNSDVDVEQPDEADPVYLIIDDDEDTTTRAHRHKPALGGFMPEESRPVVKDFSDVVKARMLASGTYDDDMPMEARGARLDPLVLLNPLCAEVWAETCKKSNAYFTFRPTHIKYAGALLTSLRSRDKTAIRQTLMSFFGFNLDKENNVALSQSLLPDSFHSADLDSSVPENLFLGDWVLHVLQIILYGSKTGFAIRFPEYFEPAPIGVIAYGLAISHYIISGCSNGLATSDNLCAATQAVIFEYYRSLLESMGQDMPNRLRNLQFRIRQHGLNSLGIDPDPPRVVVPPPVTVKWGVDDECLIGVDTRATPVRNDKPQQQKGTSSTSGGWGKGKGKAVTEDNMEMGQIPGVSEESEGVDGGYGDGGHSDGGYGNVEGPQGSDGDWEWQGMWEDGGEMNGEQRTRDEVDDMGEVEVLGEEVEEELVADEELVDEADLAGELGEVELVDKMELVDDVEYMEREGGVDGMDGIEVMEGIEGIEGMERMDMVGDSGEDEYDNATYNDAEYEDPGDEDEEYAVGVEGEDVVPVADDDEPLYDDEMPYELDSSEEDA